MRIKYIFIAIIAALMSISFLQIFNVPPFADDILPVYKSGYFTNLDINNKIIVDSFLGVKMYGKPEAGWILLEDIKKKYDIKITVYDRQGYAVPAPGEKSAEKNNDVLLILNKLQPRLKSQIQWGSYYTIIPVVSEKKCRFCHRTGQNKTLGAVTFKRSYSAVHFYSKERVLLFIVISVLFGGILFLLFKWNPEKKVEELFDKS